MITCNFQCDKHESCDKVQAQQEFVRGVVPLAAEHSLPLVVHCRGLTNTDGRAAEDVRLLIEETGQKDLPIHRHCFIGNSAEAHKWIKSFPNVMFGFTKRSLADTDTCTALRHLPMKRVQQIPLI